MKGFILLTALLFSPLSIASQTDIWKNDTWYQRGAAVLHHKQLFVSRLPNRNKTPHKSYLFWKEVRTENLQSFKNNYLYQPGDSIEVNGNFYFATGLLLSPPGEESWKSEWVQFYPDTLGTPLPPAPMYGNGDLLGIDSNNSGIRDDVERYIYFENQDHPEVIPYMNHLAAMERAQFIKYIETGTIDEGFVDIYFRAMDCIYLIDPKPLSRRNTRTAQIERNTIERWIEGLRFDKAFAGGHAITRSNISKTECEQMIKNN